MILIPFRVEITEAEAVRGMDKAWWWVKSGELPGIFTWATVGLYRVLQNGRFTKSKAISEMISEYKAESNPVIIYLNEHIEEEVGGLLFSQDAYNSYKIWCCNSGHRAISLTRFVAEIKRKFPKAEKNRIPVEEKNGFGEKKQVIKNGFHGIKMS